MIIRKYFRVIMIVKNNINRKGSITVCFLGHTYNARWNKAGKMSLKIIDRWQGTVVLWSNLLCIKLGGHEFKSRCRRFPSIFTGYHWFASSQEMEGDEMESKTRWKLENQFIFISVYFHCIFIILLAEQGTFS